MWCELFCDKYAGDHHYSNPITKNITINDLKDGSYYLLRDNDALEFFNNNFYLENFKIPSDLFSSGFYKLFIYKKNIDSNNSKIKQEVYTTISINTKKIESYLKKKREIPNLDFLKRLCMFHLHYTNFCRQEMSRYSNKISDANEIDENRKYIMDNVMLPIDYTFHEKIEKNENLTVDLFEYQKCSIYWMLNKELNLKKINYNLNDEIIMNEIYYDNKTRQFDLIKNRNSLTFHGGCLIDEVGLGKTLQMITLSLLNQENQTNYIRNGDNQYLHSRATLILCPNQLCKQWEREIKDKIKKDYEPVICLIMTKTHFDKYTYHDLLDADFVIVSFTFLGNPSFTLPWSKQVSTIKSFCKKDWTEIDCENVISTFKKMGEENVSNPFETLTKTNAFFQLINWFRIIVDEFHEVYSNKKYKYVENILPHIKSKYRWCVTATPFVDKNGVFNIIDFLTNFENMDGFNVLSNGKIVDYMSTDCFRRNTKKSIKKEHTLPPIEEEIVWLKFSRTERLMYNAYLANSNNNKFSVYLRQLCCHPQLADETKLALSNCKTLQEIEQVMLSHYKNDVKIAENKIKKVNRRITKIKKNIFKLKKRRRWNELRKMGIDIDESDDSDESDDFDGLGYFDNNLTENLDDLDNFGDLNNLDDSNNLDDLDEEFDLESKLESEFNDKYSEYNNVINYNTKTIREAEDVLDKLKDKLAVLQNECDGKRTTLNFFENVVVRIKKTSEKETKLSTIDEINENTNVMDFLNASDSDSDDDNDDNNNNNNGGNRDGDDDEEICGVCLGEIPENDIGVTKCGHMFCYQCLKNTVKIRHNCSICKTKLKDNDIYLLSYQRKKKNTDINKEDQKKEDLINEIGTKLANLIFWLRENGKHTIIFSQWDDLLRKVGRILKENGIKNVFCKGNCFQRDKAIREFNQDENIKVIMLSSEKSASGTNLTKASQVVLLDPIYGDYKYRKGQEKQAIGRAHRLGQKNIIKVVRFIIRESVEEEIYKMNQEEDKKYISNEVIDI